MLYDKQIGGYQLIERIEVDTFLKTLGSNNGGMSKPIHIMGDNGKEYILKNQNVYNEKSHSWDVWNCMFLQEVLVHKIAKHLNISTPDCAIARVDDVFLAQDPTLRFTNRFVPGYNFASKIIEGVENNLLDNFMQLVQMGKPYIIKSWKSFFNNISNKEDIPKIIALDLLTGNFDRFGNYGNVLIANTGGERVLYCIDHGHCFFGPVWENIFKRNMMHSASMDPQYIAEWLKLLAFADGFNGNSFAGLGEVFRALDQFVDVSDVSNHCFNDIVPNIERITPAMIDGWFADMPDEWYVDKGSQIATYKHFIMAKKDMLRNLINIIAERRAFDSYTGGVLTWNAQLTGTP
jgi:hypothetical protein